MVCINKQTWVGVLPLLWGRVWCGVKNGDKSYSCVFWLILDRSLGCEVKGEYTVRFICLHIIFMYHHIPILLLFSLSNFLMQNHATPTSIIWRCINWKRIRENLWQWQLELCTGVILICNWPDLLNFAGGGGQNMLKQRCKMISQPLEKPLFIWQQCQPKKKLGTM